MDITIPLTEPQEDFCFSDAPYPAIVGGLGSGKSRAGTMRLIMKMMEDPGANGAYYMPTYDLLKMRAMPGIEEDLNLLGLSYKVNKSDYLITIDGLGFVAFRSYERPERIVAYEVAHSIVDEIDTLPKDKAAFAWRKISERNRQKRKFRNTIAVVTTPDQGFNGFVYEKWAKNQQPGYKLYRASTYSNPYLPPEYIEQIRSNYDPILADMYLNGEFVSLSQNKVYHFFDRKKHGTSRVITESDRIIHVGADFNIGGCCAVAFIMDGNTPTAVDEFVSHDTADMINNLIWRYKGKKVVVYPDASGRAGSTNAARSDVSMIEEAGFAVDAPAKNPAIRDRINAYNALFAHDAIRVNTEKCPELAFSLESQGYTKKGDPEKFDAHPAIDDWLDSSGYFIHRRFPIHKPIANVPVRFSY